MPFARFAALATIGALVAGTAFAQDKFPSKPIRLLTQFGTGGATDLAARAVADAMTPHLGQQVIVEPRPGAGGQIAVGAVRDAPADGYTMLFGGQTSLVMLPIIDPATAGNPLGEFRVVTFGTDYDLILMTSAASGIKSATELLERLKKSKGEANWPGVGLGTPVDTAAAYFVKVSGGSTTMVPYKGPTQAHPDLAAGRLLFQVDTITGPWGLIQEKKLVPLAIFSKKRAKELPNVPTIAEAGIPQLLDVDWRSWNAVLVRKQTPDPVVNRLNEAARKGLSDPKFKERIAKMGHGAVGIMTADQAQAHLEAQIPLWRAMISRMDLRK